MLRTYDLKGTPHGINVDEAGMAYDAYCLANYGTDRYLNHLPVYLTNFGFGQSALYAYLASITIKLFGFGIIAIRLPAVILGIIAIVLCYFMVKEKKGEKFGLTFMALITICPWHIMASRWGLDCNLLAPMSIISIYLLLKAKNKLGYILTGISFGITLYTYALSYLIIPLFLILTLSYMLYTKKIKIKDIIIMGIPILILAIPLILMILVNKGYINEIRGFITIQKLWGYRGEEIGLVNIENNLFNIKNLFLFDGLIYNAFPQFGTLYTFASFLAVLGFFIELDSFVKNIKTRKFELDYAFLFLAISVIICMLLIIGPNINKANAIYIPLLFFTTIAIKHLYKNYKYAVLVIMILYYFNFSIFVDYYFNYYKIEHEFQPYFEKDIIEAINVVENDKELSNKNIKFITNSAQPYIYTLFNKPISPYEFNEKIYNLKDYTMSYGKYYFYYRDINDKNVYLVKDDEDFIQQLQASGFTIKNVNSYIMAYK